MRPPRGKPCRRAGFLFVLLAGLAAGAASAGAGQSAPARTRDYRIDQRYGSIRFSVGQLGLFSANGRFARFAGHLTIDRDHPTATLIDVTIEAGSAAMAEAGAASLLRSPAYFDVARFPVIRFVSHSITRAGRGHFVIHGVLTLRGIARAQTLDARLMPERTAPGSLAIDDFSVTGRVSRSAFGMTADPAFVGDTVNLAITLRLVLGGAIHAG